MTHLVLTQDTNTRWRKESTLVQIQNYIASGQVSCGTFTTLTAIDGVASLTGAHVDQILTCVDYIIRTEVAAKCYPLVTEGGNKHQTKTRVTMSYEIGEYAIVDVSIQFHLNAPGLEDELFKMMSRALDQLKVLMNILPGVWKSEEDVRWHPVCVADLVGLGSNGLVLGNNQ